MRDIFLWHLVENTGTGVDTYNVSLSGPAKEAAYITDRDSEIDYAMLNDTYRHYLITLPPSTTGVLYIMVANTGDIKDQTVLTVTVTSHETGREETNSILISPAHEAEGGKSILSGESSMLWILLVVIVLVAMVIILRRRREDDEEEDEGFSEEFDDIKPIPPSQMAGRSGGTTAKNTPKKAKDGEPRAGKKAASRGKGSEDSKGSGTALIDMSMDDLDNEISALEEEELRSIRKKGK